MDVNKTWALSHVVTLQHLSIRVGFALQAGVEIRPHRPRTLNLDFRKVFFKTGASLNRGTLLSDVTLAPWVVFAGIARRLQASSGAGAS